MPDTAEFDATPNLGLPYLWPAQAQKHVTHNEALLRLDALSQIVLAGIGALIPPETPDIGALFALGAAPTGAWSDQGGRLALWDGSGWQFLDPKEGWIAWDAVLGRLCRHDGTDWQPYTPAHLTGLGIGTAPDAQNRLAVRAPATLLTHEGAGHQLKINKSASGETASLLLQSDWQGRAEIGLTGSDDLTIKVSADGSTWQAALQVAAATGAVTLSGPVAGTAVTQTPQDQTAGRLMKTGDGGVLGPVAHNGIALDSAPFGFWGNSLAAEPPTGAPVSGAALWSGIHIGHSAGALQLAGRSDGAQGLFARARSGASWGGWRQIYDQISALGTAAFSGGANSGALLETNASGTARYLRLACGTQILWGEASLSAHAVTTASGALFASASAANISFFKTFHAAPQITLTVIEASGSPALWPALATTSTSGASLRFLATTAVTPATLKLHYQAIGRWRA